MGLTLGAGFLLLALRFYHLQVQRHDELYEKARAKYTAVSRQRGERGLIYDFHGNLLVGNIPCRNLVADPQLTGDDEHCRELADYLARRLDLPSAQVFQRLTGRERKGRKVRYAMIRRGIPLELAKAVRDELRAMRTQGLFWEEDTKRYYPKNEMLAQVLGFVNLDGERETAVTGIEQALDGRLRARPAKRIYERDRRGVPLSYGREQADGEPRNGLNVYLTINEQLQDLLELGLEDLCREFTPRAAYAIMVDPYTGNILAMAQRPTFNPNDRSRMLPDAWRNRMLNDVFDPGSTMKPFPIAGALDHGVVRPQTVFDCEHGHWFYAGKVLRDAHGYGLLSVTEIIQKSSNIGTAKIAVMMGKNRLYHTLRRFGFGERTGIQLPSESRGLFRQPTDWDALSITRFPIGQGIACTPLQLVRAYCALANGGRLVPLRLVDRYEDPETGRIVPHPYGEAPKTFLHEATRDQLLAMLKLVTQQGGTATRAAIPGYAVAGKTGTSQKVKGGNYSSSDFFATFVGFVPADRPAFVLLVTADEPQGQHYGGTVAAPVFQRIAHQALSYLNVSPDQMVATLGANAR